MDFEKMEKEFERMFDSEPNGYFIVDNGLFVCNDLHSDRFLELPNQKHNVDFCDNAIVKKIDILNDTVGELNSLTVNYSLLDRFYYKVLKNGRNGYMLNYFENILLLDKNIELFDEEVCYDFEFAFNVGGREITTIEPLKRSNIFIPDMEIIDDSAKALRKVMGIKK